jgi:5'-3' exoribonuclease 1
MQEEHAEAFTSAFKANKRAGDVPSGTYDHVYIDVNNVLHVAAHHTKNEDAFFKKLFALLDLNMRRTRPQYTVVLALDGPAPIAKTITQRRRRIRLSSGEKVPLSEDPPRLLKIGLTPGSALALKIDRALEYYAATRLLSRNALPKGLLFEISGTRVPGEGEVKILRSMKTRVRNPKFEGHSHLIVSEDSDALLLAMTAAPADVFVLSSKLVFSVRAFNASLEKDLPPGMSEAQMRGARRDFVALAVMMGNDYLPGSRFGVKYSWRAYARLRGAQADAP